MKKETLDFITLKTKEILEAPMSCQDLKDTAAEWLKAAGTEKEADQTKQYIAELKADIMPLDNLIGFAGSDTGKQYFGEDAANEIVSHAEKIKGDGAKYCDCPACSAAAAILGKIYEG